MGVANGNHRFSYHAADDIGNKPVLGPVSAADDISGACGCNSGSFLVLEERTAICRRHQFRAAFARAVRIVASHGIMLAVSPNPFAVFIAFIAGDDHHRAHGWGLTRGFENIHRAHHIRGISLDGFLIRAQHQGLGRRMKDNLRTALLEQLQDRSKIADISED